MLLVIITMPVTSYVKHTYCMHPLCVPTKYLAYMIYMPSLMGINLAITCEVIVALCCVLAYICKNTVLYAHIDVGCVRYICNVAAMCVLWYILSIYTVFLVSWLMPVTLYVAYIFISICHICPSNIWHMCQIWWGSFLLAHFCNNVWSRYCIWLSCGILMENHLVPMAILHISCVTYICNAIAMFFQWCISNICRVTLKLQTWGVAGYRALCTWRQSWNCRLLGGSTSGGLLRSLGMQRSWRQ